MTTVSDALKALREVVLIHANVERLESSVDKMSDDIDGLADGVGVLRDRVARLEGFLEGAAAAQRTPRLPSE